MKRLVLFLEEASAKAAFEGLLPRVLPEGVDVRYVVFEGKSDLEKQLGKRLRGWIHPNTAFLVLRDQDAADCHAVKQKLVQICHEAGKPSAVVRVACRELESWYFGELSAVEQALGIPKLSDQSRKAKYRTPDAIHSPSAELAKITKGRYQKVSGSRAIGQFLSPNTANNTSVSFSHFLTGITKALAHACT
jgi:hypothetical protein